MRAFDASNLGNELWNSEQNSTRDSSHMLGKFASVTVANGRVYVPSFGTSTTGGSGEIEAYGLLPSFKSEIETIPETNTAGVIYAVQSDPAASNGQWGKLSATAVGQYVEYTVGGIVQGTTYKITVGYKTDPSRGQCALTVNGNAHGTLDEYANGNTFTSAVLDTFVAVSPGNTRAFRFTVTGKNAASSGYTLGFDYITLTPQ